MDTTLDPVEIRAIGSLIEKQHTTPDIYPLTLNALMNACNQSTSRDPVTHYDENALSQAMERLRQRGLVWTVRGGRAQKFEHRLEEKLGLSQPELAAMCLLMLRGPQTPGEIRGRSGRLHPFASIEEVETLLESLAHREIPLVGKLPRAPGTKEARYAHRLGGEVSAEAALGPARIGEAVPDAAVRATPARVEEDRVARLEEQVDALRDEVEALRTEIAELRRPVG